MISGPPCSGPISCDIGHSIRPLHRVECDRNYLEERTWLNLPVVLWRFVPMQTVQKEFVVHNILPSGPRNPRYFLS
jgi:hypothetical protein